MPSAYFVSKRNTYCGAVFHSWLDTRPPPEVYHYKTCVILRLKGDKPRTIDQYVGRKRMIACSAKIKKGPYPYYCVRIRPFFKEGKISQPICRWGSACQRKYSWIHDLAVKLSGQKSCLEPLDKAVHRINRQAGRLTNGGRIRGHKNSRPHMQCHSSYGYSSLS